MRHKKYNFSREEKINIVEDYLKHNLRYSDIMKKYKVFDIPKASFVSLVGKFQDEIEVMKAVGFYNLKAEKGFNNLGSKKEPYYKNEFEYGAYPLHNFEDLIAEVHGNN